MTTTLSGDAWLLQQLDNLKRLSTEINSDGGLMPTNEYDDQIHERADADGLALANPYFP